MFSMAQILSPCLDVVCIDSNYLDLTRKPQNVVECKMQADELS